MHRDSQRPSILKAAKARHERTLQRIGWVEKWIPGFGAFSRHPKYGQWAPVAFTVLEVGLGVLALIFVLPLLSQIPLPKINVPFPDIALPSFPWPQIDFPPIPQWLDTILYWLSKTWPVWLAVGFAAFKIRE